MESDEIKKKRYYIYENISSIKNQDQIIDLIILKECKFTENNNGIFLNLSVLDDDIITSIYQIIINSLNYEEQNKEYITQTIELPKQKIKKTKSNSGKENTTNENIPIKQFKKKEQEIILYSKKYNL